MWFVYFLQSTIKENWIYVGSTNSLDTRLREHNAGKVTSTKAYRPLEIIYTEEFDSEKKLEVKSNIIKDGMEELKRLK